jgi:hypothetical protein
MVNATDTLKALSGARPNNTLLTLTQSVEWPIMGWLLTFKENYAALRAHNLAGTDPTNTIALINAMTTSFKRDVMPDLSFRVAEKKNEMRQEINEIVHQLGGMPLVRGEHNTEAMWWMHRFDAMQIFLASTPAHSESSNLSLLLETDVRLLRRAEEVLQRWNSESERVDRAKVAALNSTNNPGGRLGKKDQEFFTKWKLRQTAPRADMSDVFKDKGYEG